MKDERRQRWWEWGTFSGLLAVVCVVLTVLPLPRGGRSEAMRERLYLLPTVQSFEPPSSTEEDTRSLEESESSEPEAALSLEDMAGLLEEAFGAQEGVAETASSPELSSRPATALTVEGLDLDSWDAGVGSDRPEVAQDRALNLHGNASSVRRLRPTLIQGDLAGGEAGDFRMQITGSDSSADTLLEARTKPRLDAPHPVTAEEFEAAVAEDSLALWIRANPSSSLDPGIKSLFGWKPGMLSARDSVQIEGTAYGLQMMLSPASGEIRIAMVVGGADIYYFISPKVRRQASYFQKGTVRTDAAGSIVTVESEDFSPQGAEAQAFYERFVAWWRVQNR